MDINSSKPAATGRHGPDAGGHDGLWLLRHPVLPLLRMVMFLFFTGPFKSVKVIIDEMVEPVETGSEVYDEPAGLLASYLPIIQQLDILKNSGQQPGPLPAIVSEESKPVGRSSSVALWVCQQVLNQELELINSVLCGPCNCVLCCVGPDYLGGEQGLKPAMRQDFFEIPLGDEELGLFDVPKIDNQQTRSLCANSEPSLQLQGRAFYETGRAIYHWQTGWGLVLPRGAACPQLDEPSGRCRIYARRPVVCRRPQIFPYLLEKQSDSSQTVEGGGQDKEAVYVARKKLLAVWDCPYVKKYQDEIAGFAQLSGLEPVFMTNKE